MYIAKAYHEFDVSFDYYDGLRKYAHLFHKKQNKHFFKSRMNHENVYVFLLKQMRKDHLKKQLEFIGEEEKPEKPNLSCDEAMLVENPASSYMHCHLSILEDISLLF